MQNLSEIKTRQKAIEQTRKMTNAMSLLATSRMKKSMQKIDYFNEYYGRVRSAMKSMLEKSPNFDHPYINGRDVKRSAFVVIAGDRGMCGSYNANVLNYAFSEITKYPDSYIVSIGKMATSFFTKRGKKPNISIEGFSHLPELSDVRHIVNALMYGYDNKRIDEINVIYTHFENALKQHPAKIHLLPLDISDFKDVHKESHYSSNAIIEPSPKQLFETIVPYYAVGLIFDVASQSVTSEHCARMNAMQNATNNADDVIEDLKIKYNTARQFSITQQIAEISSGAAALERGEEYE